MYQCKGIPETAQTASDDVLGDLFGQLFKSDYQTQKEIRCSFSYNNQRIAPLVEVLDMGHAASMLVRRCALRGHANGLSTQ
jgi:hypothetical protein